MTNPVVIESMVLSKVGRVVMRGDDRKKRIVLEGAVIVQQNRESNRLNVQKPIAEAIEIGRIFFENPPEVCNKPNSSRSKPKSKAAEPKARERSKAAERKARERENTHYVAQAKLLDSGTEFGQYPAKWTRDIPWDEQKVTNPEFIEGMVLSEAGSVVMHDRKKTFLEGAVMVQRHRESNRLNVQKPIAEPIEIGRICPEKPLEVYNKHYPACQLTGSCSAPNGVRHVLIKFGSNKETWWVPESDISQRTINNRRRSVKKINYREDDLAEPSADKPPADLGDCLAEPPADSGDCLVEPPADTGDCGKQEDRKQCSPINSDHVLNKSQHISLLNEVFQEASTSLIRDQQNNGTLTIPTATTAAVETLKPEDKPKLHKNTCDLVLLSLIYQAVSSGHTEGGGHIKIRELSIALGMHAHEHNYLNGILGVLEERTKKRAASRKLASSKSKKVCHGCNAEGCSATAHATSNFLFCFKHWEQKTCPKCKTRNSRRKGGLCDPCWDKK